MSLISAIALAGELASTVHTVTKASTSATFTTFKRGDVTNLVRRTYMRDGKVRSLRQQVYCRGYLALTLWRDETGLISSAESIPDIKVGTEFTPDGKLNSVNIMTKEGIVVDHFAVTNGLLYPIATADIRKGNQVSKDVEGILGSVTTNTTPDQLRRRVLELRKKYGK